MNERIANDRKKHGEIGAGAWSGTVCDAMMKSKKVQLVTCFDVIPTKQQALSAKFGCSQEASYEDVLKRNDIDAVHLLSPNAVHAEQAILAARHGKHVFVEKPLANTIPDGTKTIAACQKANVVLMVGQHLRRLAGFRKLKALIIDEFADCIRTGKKPETDGEGGLQALAFIRAAIESARTGKQARIVI